METHRPEGAALFVWDIIRLAAMLGILTAFSPGMGGNAVFPYAVYAVPNAFFPLMAFFLWLWPSHYRPYVFLYIAGKIIALTAAAGWFCFFLPKVSQPDPFIASSLPVLGFTLLLAGTDALSVLGALMLKKKLFPKAPEEPDESQGSGDGGIS